MFSSLSYYLYYSPDILYHSKNFSALCPRSCWLANRPIPQLQTSPRIGPKYRHHGKLSCDTSDLGSTNSLTMQAGGNSDEVFVGSIDNGTTSSRFLIFDTKGNPVAS